MFWLRITCYFFGNPASKVAWSQRGLNSGPSDSQPDAKVTFSSFLNISKHALQYFFIKIMKLLLVWQIVCWCWGSNPRPFSSLSPLGSSNEKYTFCIELFSILVSVKIRVHAVCSHHQTHPSRKCPD